MNYGSEYGNAGAGGIDGLEPGMISAKKDQLMNEVRHELAMAHAQELLTV